MVEELGDGEQVFVMEKKSCEMSPGETESSGSAPPHSERYFDDQEVLRASLRCQSPNDDSHNHVLQSPEISSNNDENEDHETVKSLSEKLSAALLNISAKEDLVKQHSKVAEEAVSGWEKAETEVAALKQQLDVATQKNSALEDRINHLDGALKECVRQLRQSKEEHEQKVRDAVIRKTQEWESNKSKLENQLIELRTQLEASKGEAEKLETIEKENAALKGKLLALSEELEIQRIESELSTKTAETASKQHLESIKKVAKLEAECRKLRATARKTPSTFNDPKATSSSACVESLTDSQSDNCSDSWASALIAELDQFKNEKTGAKVVASSVDIDLMDDFLEMERLAAMPEADHGSSSFVLEADGTSKDEDGDEKLKMAQLEEKVEILENEKAKLYMALADCQNQLTVAEGKLVSVEVKRKTLESQLELTLLEAEKLRDMVASLEEGKVEESAYSSELKARLEASEERRVAFESQAHLAYLEVEKLREKVILLESRVEEERTLTAELASKLDSMEKMKEKVSLLEAMEGEKQVLELELELAESKVQRLNEERTLSAELASKSDSMEKMKEKVSLLEAMEGEKQVLELGLELAESEVQRLNDEMRTLSAELASKLDSMEKMKEMVSLLEAMEGEKKALELELELEQSEVQRLNDEMSLLEQKFDRERALSKQFAERCQNLEDELSRKKREAELRVVSCSNGDLTAKQEKELAVAAEKLAECQRTIASLGQQLKSLMKLDDIMFESEKLDLNGKCKGVKH